MNLPEMTELVRAFVYAKGWRNDHTAFGEYIALLHSEASEALEAYRDHRLADATVPHFCIASCEHDGPVLDKPQGVGSEFADLLIRLLDTCDVYGIDLEAEFRRKLAYNWTRPYQHGGRTLTGPKPARDGGAA